MAEGNIEAPQVDLARRPGGVDEQGAHTKVPQEPGRPRRFLGVTGDGNPDNNPGPRRQRLSNRGSETRGAPRYRRAEGLPKRSGTGVWESERPIVVMNSGNPPQGTRGSEGAAGKRNRRRER